MCWVDRWEIMPTRRFSSTIFLTFSMLSSLTEVNGRLAWGKFSKTSRPSLNALCHSNTCVLDKVDSPKHFCNTFNDSVAVIPLETQNFKQTRCTLFFRSKNRQTNFLRRKPMAAKHSNGRLPLKLYTNVKEGVTSLEKKLFTVSVYARGLTGPVWVKFDQMACYGRLYALNIYL